MTKWIDLLEFLKLVGKLKKVERTGWVTRLGVENPESVAEHSYRASLIALVIGEIKKIDTGRLIKMLLLHDLAESVIGDFDLFAKKKIGEKVWKEKERKAMRDILYGNLSKEIAQTYYEIWMEFDEQSTELGKLAYQIDKLELLLQAFDYEKEGYPKNKIDHFWNVTEHLIIDKDLKILLDVLKQSRVS